METRYLKTLIAVVDCGSFSKASELLHITQSAVSQRIKFLEEHFGQQLLDRSGSKLVLTTAGGTVLLKARKSSPRNRSFSALCRTTRNASPSPSAAHQPSAWPFSPRFSTISFAATPT